MNMLEGLLGGGKQRSDWDDFVGRYDQGSPYDGISDREAVDRYQQVAPQLPPDLYEESAQEAFARMSPQERAQFVQYLRQRAQQQNMNFPDLNQDGIDDRVQQDPRELARMTTRMGQQQPGGLGALLGGGGSGGGGGGGMGDLLGNPLAKAALAGVAAIAVKKMMDRR